eukprot:TRINITY_DN12844_c1_g1_i4.p1 TRINITY_DN12844_c1_g1~~TRINITY_DN12844_c1_g1_i4.p1  ORF type:complete len:525 (-),score=47.03 TRINITY_DN12844_c1_g1_i4:100-1629(-)
MAMCSTGMEILFPTDLMAHLAAVLCSMYILVHALMQFTALRILSRMELLLVEIADTSLGRQLAYAQHAVRMVRCHRRAGVTRAFTTVPFGIFILPESLVPNQRFVLWWKAYVCLPCFLLKFTGHQYMLVALSGALHRRQTTLRAEVSRRGPRLHVSMEWPEWPSTNCMGWQMQVQQLACRALTLKALLEFYKGLGTEYMHHYDPSHHRTLDVVRMAIIPMSLKARSSAASVMMHGESTRPRTMVTHNWGNLFRDLVAAIVADALHEAEFGMIAFFLEHDFEAIEQKVSAAGVSMNCYWVCAFAVNQHSGICGTNPQGTRDVKSGALHPVCQCDLPKVWNDSVPLAADGRSVACEMNKFDDMMIYLSTTDQHFRQIIAVDASFQLFSRAWCVAEIVTGSKLGIEQSLKISSAAALASHESRLKSMNVEDMDSTDPADRERILASIDDTAAFNRHLHAMLFEELLPQWKRLDGRGQMHHVGRLLHWRTCSDDVELISKMHARESPFPSLRP